MFSSILNSNQGNLSVSLELICMATSLVLGLLIACVHMFTQKSSKNFIVSLAILPLIVQVIITMVNGNLGTSVAIVGAFSLIRFRSIPGSSRDLVSVFLAMAVGLATAMGYITFAITFTIIAVVALAILSKVEKEKNDEMYLKILIPEDLDYTKSFEDLFKQYLKNVEFEKAKTVNMGSMYEVTYRVNLLDINMQKQFIDEIRCRNGNLKVVLEKIPSCISEL